MRLRKRKLQKLGGSVMSPVPPALLDLLHLTAGAEVGLAVERGRWIVAPRPRPCYTLAELLAQADDSHQSHPGRANGSMLRGSGVSRCAAR